MPSQKIRIENSGGAVEAPEGDLRQFDTRLEDLRKTLQSSFPSPPQPSPQSQPKPVTSRIRHLGWLSAAFVFFAVLFIRWNGQATELLGTYIFSLVVSGIFLSFMELVIWAISRARFRRALRSRDY